MATRKTTTGRKAKSARHPADGPRSRRTLKLVRERVAEQFRATASLHMSQAFDEMMRQSVPYNYPVNVGQFAVMYFDAFRTCLKNREQAFTQQAMLHATRKARATGKAVRS